MNETRTQLFDGGKVALPIPVHPRFILRDKGRYEEWMWILSDDSGMTLKELRKKNKMEWQSCCAVASWAWWHEAREQSATTPATGFVVKQAIRNAQKWNAELENLTHWHNYSFTYPKITRAKKAVWLRKMRRLLRRV